MIYVLLDDTGRYIAGFTSEATACAAVAVFLPESPVIEVWEDTLDVTAPTCRMVTRVSRLEITTGV